MVRTIPFAAAALALAVALGLSMPALLASLFRLSAGRMDAAVGTLDRVGPDVLAERLRDKSALVVGATRGIGRGIAVALARAGASVRVVGRSKEGGAAVVASMAAVAPSKAQLFRAYSHDLFTVKGCLRLVAELQEESTQFDFLVFTVGMWPDLSQPNTTDGINKVFALDVLSRFAVFEGVRSLLAKDARVMSVLASTTWMPLQKTETLKAIISGEAAPGLGGFGMLPVSAVSADALLQQAAVRNPGMRFVGTQPGVVATAVMRSSFPGWLADSLQFLVAQIGQTEEESGDVHVNILSAPNLKNQQVSYVNYLLEARHTTDLAYDEHFGTWLWKFLEGVVAENK